MTNKATHNKKSLCERSMKMVVDVIKVSFFSIAKMSLGMMTRLPEAATGNHASVKGSLRVMDTVSVPRVPGSSKLQEPESGSKPHLYLIEAHEEKGSSYMIDEEKDINQRAMDYIRRIHEKNRIDSSNSPRLFLNIPRPPPPQVK